MAVQKPMQHGVDLGLDIGGADDILVDRGNWCAFWVTSIRVGQSKTRRQVARRAGGRCTEQQVLALAGNHLQDVSQLRHESHVHHSICLVEHHRMKLWQRVRPSSRAP